MQNFFRDCEKVRMRIECTDKFHNGIKEIYDRGFYMNKISVLWMRRYVKTMSYKNTLSYIDSLVCHLCQDP